MNPEIKEKWLAALRSGDYKQGQRRLVVSEINDERRYCCLGVLCDLATKEGIGEWVTNRLGVVFHDENGDAELALPDSVLNWADLQYSDPAVGGPHLSELNDSKGYTFEAIADEIDKHL